MPETNKLESAPNCPDPRPADLLAEILVNEQEILKSLNFLKNYFRWQIIWGGVKWAVLIAVIILGFISLKSLAAYFQGYADVFKNYSDQSAAANAQFDSLKNLINVNGR